jgi:hypothetical protein
MGIITGSMAMATGDPFTMDGSLMMVDFVTVEG